ncbi:uncharacterized protein ARMOST_03949 [Armillaria ostoyae]|uniref:Uncharacterized protein n=1 Tax=Armillaria ostoyae TaxID=47428 RepID=A0A284QVY6_ARMOS|nr:uncharacterized protein ARMOST_03949 [Armillaria ostoyae]
MFIVADQMACALEATFILVIYHHDLVADGQRDRDVAGNWIVQESARLLPEPPSQVPAFNGENTDNTLNPCCR